MKRVISALLAIWLLIGLCACNDSETETPANEVTDTSVQAVIDLASALPVGTMGVSLKVVESAVKLMDWCEATTLPAGHVTVQLTEYCESLDTTEYSMFYEQVSLLVSKAEEWQDKEQLESDLRMVGLNPKDYSWSAGAFATLEGVLMGVADVIYD